MTVTSSAMKVAVINESGEPELARLQPLKVVMNHGANRFATDYRVYWRGRSRRIFKESPVRYFVRMGGRNFYLELRL